MRTLFVEVKIQVVAQVDRHELVGTKKQMPPREVTRTVYETLRIEVPDNAKVTLQGKNPAKPEFDNNPSTVRVYDGTKQILAIPNAINFRDSSVKVQRLAKKKNVVGKGWVEVGDKPLNQSQGTWLVVENDGEEEFELDMAF